jgi:hypothetical protein
MHPISVTSFSPGDVCAAAAKPPNMTTNPTPTPASLLVILPPLFA